MAINKVFNEIVDSNNTPNFDVRSKRCLRNLTVVTEDFSEHNF